MSFYVGRHRLPNGAIKRQLHITKGEHNLNVMKGPPFSDTVFHTDISYSKYKVFKYSSIQTIPPTFGGTETRYLYRFPNEALALLKAGYAYLTVGTGFNTIVNGNGLYNYWTDDVAFGYYASYPTVRSTTIGAFWEKDTDVSVIIFNFKFNGSFDRRVSDGSADILINDHTFRVNGINILNEQFLSSTEINPYDEKITGWYPKYSYLDQPDATHWMGSFQLMNTFPDLVANEVKFSSKGDLTEIEVNRKVIITTMYGTQKVQIKDVKHTSGPLWALGSSNNGEYTYGPIGSGYKVGDLLYLALRFYFRDTNNNYELHDVQRIISWQKGEIDIMIEWRLFSSLKLRFRTNGTVYIVMSQIMEPVQLETSECSIMRLN